MVAPQPATQDRGARLQAEASLIRRHVRGDDQLVVLDERGKALTTSELSVALGEWLQHPSRTVLAIGGHDGIDPALRSSARTVMSLSALTLPHALVQVLLLEQLYRAWSVLNNHPYHRDGE